MRTLRIFWLLLLFTFSTSSIFADDFTDLGLIVASSIAKVACGYYIDPVVRSVTRTHGPILGEVCGLVMTGLQHRTIDVAAGAWASNPNNVREKACWFGLGLTLYLVYTHTPPNNVPAPVGPGALPAG